MAVGGETGCDHDPEFNICFCKESAAIAAITGALAELPSKPAECAIKCPKNQVCDYCQGKGEALADPSKDIIGSTRMTAQVNTAKQHPAPMTELTGPLRPAPRRLTDEDILDVWSKYNPLDDWSYVGFGRAVEARIFGDVK